MSKYSNKRERRAAVMARRYAKLDQREQVSRVMQKALDDQKAYMEYLRNQDHPISKILKQLLAEWDQTQDFTVFTEWHKNNPDMTVPIQDYMKQALKEFNELKNDT